MTSSGIVFLKFDPTNTISILKQGFMTELDSQLAKTHVNKMKQSTLSFKPKSSGLDIPLALYSLHIAAMENVDVQLIINILNFIIHILSVDMFWYNQFVFLIKICDRFLLYSFLYVF